MSLADVLIKLVGRLPVSIFACVFACKEKSCILLKDIGRELQHLSTGRHWARIAIGVGLRVHPTSHVSVHCVLVLLCVRDLCQTCVLRMLL